MKAISLWQPWASAIAVGAKTVETRSWATPHRGPIAIHAAKRINKSEMRDFSVNLNWRSALAVEPCLDLARHLPFGALVAVAELVDCIPTESFTSGFLLAERTRDGFFGIWDEDDMGNFDPGRFGWVLKNIRPLKYPLPWKGRQGLFTVPDKLLLRHV